MPMGIVSAITANAPGRIARPMPPPAIRASATVTARMAPTRAASGAAAGANTPMPITGMAPSSAATEWLMPSASCARGSTGPSPTSWGRRRQRCERDRDEQTDAAAQRPAGHRSSYRGFRFSTNAETPSAKSCVPRSNP